MGAPFILPPTPIPTPFSTGVGGTGNANGDASGLSVLATGGTTARLLSDILMQFLTPESYGAKGDGVTDDTVAFNQAAAALSAIGGGRLALRTGKIYFLGSSITLPTHVFLSGAVNAGNIGTNWDGTQTTPRIVMAAGTTITCPLNSGIIGVALVRAGIALSGMTDWRQAVDQVKNLYSGTAVKMTGNEVILRDVAFFGHNLPIDTNGTCRFDISQVFFDCINGIRIDNAHDVCTVTRARSNSVLNAVGGGGQFPTWAVTGAANNGSGLIRLTFTAQSYASPRVGDTVWVTNVGGVSAAIGRWTVAAVGTNTIDLAGTSFAGTYTSGGSIIIDTTRRPGTFIAITSSEAPTLIDCFSHGSDVAYLLGDGAGWVNALGCGGDGYALAQDPLRTMWSFTGNSYGHNIIGGWTSSAARLVNFASTNTSFTTSIIGVAFSGTNGANMFNITGGKILFSACRCTETGTFTVGSGVAAVTVAGSDFSQLTLASSAAAGVLQADFSTRWASGSAPSSGTLASLQIGNATTTTVASKLTLYGAPSADTNRGGETKWFNQFAATPAFYWRQNSGGNIEWLNNSYSLIATLSQAGAFSPVDILPTGTKTASAALMGPVSGASAAAPTWRRPDVTDVTNAAPTNATAAFGTAVTVGATGSTTGSLTIGSATAGLGPASTLVLQGNPSADNNRAGEVRWNNSIAATPSYYIRQNTGGGFEWLNNSYAPVILFSQSGLITASDLAVSGAKAASTVLIGPTSGNSATSPTWRKPDVTDVSNAAPTNATAAFGAAVTIGAAGTTAGSLTIGSTTTGAGPSTTLILQGNPSADNNRAGEIRWNNAIAPTPSYYIRQNTGGGFEWLNNSYAPVITFSQAGLVTATDLAVSGTKAASTVLMGPASGASAAAPTWRKPDVTDITNAAPTNAVAVFTTGVTVGAAGNAAASLAVGSGTSALGPSTPLVVRGTPSADGARGGEIQQVNPTSSTPSMYERLEGSGARVWLNNAYSPIKKLLQSGLEILYPPSSASPQGPGQVCLEFTSNTQVTFRAYGSDGTTRQFPHYADNIFPGPFASDSAAASGGVVINAPYRSTNGTLVWRQA